MAVTDAEKLYNSVLYSLHTRVPILSGNMAMFINTVESYGNEFVISIEAPFYDRKEWKKTGAIKHTGETRNGKTDYAQWVNDSGAFGTHNKSMHWVNRVCVEAATVLASEIGATVINELEL
jgi:hypothetical protein